MNNEILFSLLNTLVLPGWFLLFLAPRWKFTQPFILSILLLILSLIYLILIFPTLKDFDPLLFSSLGGIKSLFLNEKALLAGWVHYLAFDLFVGANIVRKGIELEYKRWQYTICLPFTFMFGPLGYLVFLSLKLFSKQKL